jgi:4-diphosphocytidyl-2-C-methyl-D-erythritol kinase
MTTSSAWPAPAKINRFLHIVGRRADGYHLLQTVFQFLDYCDYLYFEPRGDGRVRLAGYAAVAAPEEDLIVRAARLLQERTGCGMGVNVHVDKRIPVGGGLGGGSSDAATTLHALSAIWQLGLSVTELARLGLELGADVPVFVHARAAWAEGVGEVLTPVELDEPWFLVINPNCPVSTAEVFGHPKLTRHSPRTTIAGFQQGGARNDCEPVVRALKPPVARALDWLGRFAPARLSGTGCCLFAPFADRARAEALLAQLPVGWDGFVARGVNESPLLQRLGMRP